MKRNKTIVFTGGGSGGHITPVLSVADSIRKNAPDIKLVYIGQKGDSLGDIVHENALFDAVYTVRAGKFRRYHGEGLKQLLDIKTMWLNARDGFYTIIGLVQSYKLLKSINPKLVFCKGGFVGVPVGLAAALRRIPYITHDSDVIPGLANRIISPWATVHAVAHSKELYSYPTDKTVTVGVPIQAGFVKVTSEIQAKAKEKLGLHKKAWVLLVVGGGLGAARVNAAVVEAVEQLFKAIPELHILHVAGRATEVNVREAYEEKLSEEQMSQIHVYGFTQDMVTLSKAADVVVTRAGATAMAEFSVQGKACIMVPNPVLTGGHQLKNAQVYADANAALILSEQNLPLLAEMVVKLHGDKSKQQELSENILAFANKQSSHTLAGVILTLMSKE